MTSIEKIGDFQKEFVEAVRARADGIFAHWDLDKERDSGKQYPRYLSANLAPLIEAIEPLNMANNVFRNILAEFNSDVKKLLVSRSPAEFMRNIGQLWQVDALEGIPGVIEGLVKTNLDLALSFGISFPHLSGANTSLYGEALLEYLFSDHGYRTVSGRCIQAPKLFSALEWDASASSNTGVGGVNEEIETIKSMLKDLERQVRTTRGEMTAERYLRDIARVCVEVTGDRMYDLEGRYERLKKKHAGNHEAKLVSWFDSFGNLAEATILPAVETALSGIGTIQLNPKIVTALATFCSVTVRKATEHAYLQVIGF